GGPRLLRQETRFFRLCLRQLPERFGCIVSCFGSALPRLDSTLCGRTLPGEAEPGADARADGQQGHDREHEAGPPHLVPSAIKPGLAALPRSFGRDLDEADHLWIHLVST